MTTYRVELSSHLHGYWSWTADLEARDGRIADAAVAAAIREKLARTAHPAARVIAEAKDTFVLLLWNDKTGKLEKHQTLSSLTGWLPPAVDPGVNPELARRYNHHVPNGVQGEKLGRVRDLMREAAARVVELVPPGREQATALTKLEEAMFWANAGIARPAPVKEPT